MFILFLWKKWTLKLFKELERNSEKDYKLDYKFKEFSNYV